MGTDQKTKLIREEDEEGEGSKSVDNDDKLKESRKDIAVKQKLISRRIEAGEC
jgi:hypothetical protein